MGENFKERMKRMRKRAGFKSQGAAADVIGCERGTVGMWESPSSLVESVGGEYLLAVARAYKVRTESVNDPSVADGFPFTPSQPVSLDSSRLSQAIEMLRTLGELQGVTELYADGEALTVAYTFLTEVGATQERSNILDLTRKLASRLRGHDECGGSSKAG